MSPRAGIGLGNSPGEGIRAIFIESWARSISWEHASVAVGAGSSHVEVRALSGTDTRATRSDNVKDREREGEQRLCMRV